MAWNPRLKLTEEMYREVDRVHLMMYDGTGDKQAPKYDEKSEQYRNAMMGVVDSFIQQVLKLGCPREKLIVGIPAYARQSDHPENAKTFAELYDEIMVVAGDEGQPSLKNTIGNLDSFLGYRWDSPRLVRQKVQYVREQNLGGVFFWELGQDKQVENVAPGGILLQAAAKHAAKPVVKARHQEEAKPEL
jgi:GH18 family chitinase